MDANDREAEFVSLLTEHQLALKLFVNSLLPGDAAAADVAQEVSATVWKKRADFVPGTNFRAWIFRISRNQVANYRRKQAREGGVMMFSDSLQETIAAELGDQTTDLEHRLRALRHCLQKLPSSDRALIQHRYFHQTPLGDYASQIGRTVGTLKVKLHRIRNSLERCVSQQLCTDGESTP
ncbi:MAG: sigma-70 family RNA polymerase sigma factor [Planctomycetota bacterium]|nr:sigma-70 family RNA polymerase sigma factor [Planctomycetota bacterium]